MTPRKLKLEPFELTKGKELGVEFLAKILGGDETVMENAVYNCNTPSFTYSAQVKADVEPSKEK